MGVPPHHPPADLLTNFDEQLQEFYRDVIYKELDIRDKKKALEIRRALKKVVNAYKRQNINNRSPIRFDSGAKRCAYVLKHSPCFTSAVAKYILELLDNKPHLLHSSLMKGELNMCCLGGGPASDAVAFSKILREFYRPYWLETGRSLNFRITIVDWNEDWEITARNVLETLQRQFSYVNEIKFRFRFIQADLIQPLCTVVKETLKNADILTMVFFLSAVNEGQDKKESYIMVQELMKAMKPGAILFFLDSAIEVHYKQMNRAAEILENMESINGPHLEEFHALSLESVKTFLELYKKEFKKFVCMTNCFVSTGTWCKLEETFCIRRPIRSCSFSKEEEDELLLRKSDLTSRMLAFRAEVQKLLTSEFDLNITENEESSSDDADESVEIFGSSLCDYFDSLPEYFFQTKSKKKRIFTGDPLFI